MELEFDKEINAILRKARPAKGVLPETEAHVDADAIAAFSENALPEKTRTMYIRHFADCDDCRMLLSHAVQMNTEAAPALENVPAVPVIETVVPWYQPIFRMPNLAVAMGALVFVFSGVLGFVVLQNRSRESNARVAQIEAPTERLDGPYSEGNAPFPTASAVPPASFSSNSNTTTAVANTAVANAPLADPRSAAGAMPQMQPANNESRNGRFQIDGASSTLR